jgi:hypothetical protein
MPLTNTAEEAINETAALLGKYVPGEALGAVEHDTISRAIDRVLAESQKIIVVDRDQIPNTYFETFCRLFAITAAASFSNVPREMAVVLEHEQRLRYLVAQSPTYEVLAVNYF